MNRQFRNFAGFAVVAALAFAANLPAARAETALQKRAKLEAALDRAVNAALNGPEVKKLKVNGHEFNVKKCKIVQNGGTTTITGQISHCLTARPDDQL